jgi:thiosulfate dehydrogenase
MAFIRSSWLPLFLGIMILGVIIIKLCFIITPSQIVRTQHSFDRRSEEWIPPDITKLPDDQQGRQIRYGRELIHNTAYYYGPKGILGSLTNGMNCENCHIDAGTVNYANPFSAVAACYPKYRPRSGQVETVAFRINECMQRSLNGNPINTQSEEMKAMSAYINWLGEDVPKDVKPKGSGTQMLPYLNRAADTIRGKSIYAKTCARCHGKEGEGKLNEEGYGYQYPPLWGEHSFNVSAGMYTLTPLAGFIKNNMPFGTTFENPALTNEQAWDVAAFVCSKPRPMKLFTYDWKDISRKPVDYPFGPYADRFSELRHKYGPFTAMK